MSVFKVFMQYERLCVHCEVYKFLTEFTGPATVCMPCKRLLHMTTAGPVLAQKVRCAKCGVQWDVIKLYQRSVLNCPICVERNSCLRL